MSKKLFLGLILCVGSQAVNAASAGTPAQSLTPEQHREAAARHFTAIGTNILAAVNGIGGAGKSTILATNHAGRFVLGCARQVMAPAIENPGTTLATLTATGLTIYITPRWVIEAALKKGAEYAALGIFCTLGYKLISRNNGAPTQP